MRAFYFGAMVSSFSSPILSGLKLDVLPYFHTLCGLSVNLERRS